METAGALPLHRTHDELSAAIRGRGESAGAGEAGLLPGELFARGSRSRGRPAAAGTRRGRGGADGTSVRPQFAVSESRRAAAARFRERVRRENVGAVLPEVQPVA